MPGRRDDWRLAVFFVVIGAGDSGEGWFIFSAVFFFFGTGVQWLNDFNSFIVQRLVRKCFLVLLLEVGVIQKGERYKTVRLMLGWDDALR